MKNKYGEDKKGTCLSKNSHTDIIRQYYSSNKGDFLYKIRNGKPMSKREKKELLDIVKDSIELNEERNCDYIEYSLKLDKSSLPIKLTSHNPCRKVISISIGNESISYLNKARKKARRAGNSLSLVISKYLELWIRDELKINISAQKSANNSLNNGHFNFRIPSTYKYVFEEARKKAKENNYSFSSIVREVLKKYNETSQILK